MFHRNKKLITFFFFCIIIDVPSPPRNLRQSTTDNTHSAKIEWDAPVFTGGDGISTLIYDISIPCVNYFVEVNCTESNCSHTITANGIDIHFNMSYDVEVTAVNTCGEKSSPESVTVRIDANGEFSNDNNVVTAYGASLDKY